jgi:hypothetical protein
MPVILSGDRERRRDPEALPERVDRDTGALPRSAGTQLRS